MFACCDEFALLLCGGGQFFCPPQSIVHRMLMLRCEDELEQMEGGEQ